MQDDSAELPRRIEFGLDASCGVDMFQVRSDVARRRPSFSENKNSLSRRLNLILSTT